MYFIFRYACLVFVRTCVRACVRVYVFICVGDIDDLTLTVSILFSFCCYLFLYVNEAILYTNLIPKQTGTRGNGKEKHRKTWNMNRIWLKLIFVFVSTLVWLEICLSWLGAALLLPHTHTEKKTQTHTAIYMHTLSLVYFIFCFFFISKSFTKNWIRNGQIYETHTKSILYRWL